jgi:hypothetical protein
MLLQIAGRCATDQQSLDFMMAGLVESWELERVWKGLQCEIREALPGPQ